MDSMNTSQLTRVPILRGKSISTRNSTLTGEYVVGYFDENRPGQGISVGLPVHRILRRAIRLRRFPRVRTRNGESTPFEASHGSGMTASRPSAIDHTTSVLAAATGTGVRRCAGSSTKHRTVPGMATIVERRSFTVHRRRGRWSEFRKNR